MIEGRQRRNQPAQSPEMLDSLAESWNVSCQQIYKQVRERPMTAVAIGLAAGLGAGVWLGSRIFAEEETYQQRIADSMPNLSQVRKTIMDAVGQVIPESVRSSFSK